MCLSVGVAGASLGVCAHCVCVSASVCGMYIGSVQVRISVSLCDTSVSV